MCVCVLHHEAVVPDAVRSIVEFATFPTSARAFPVRRMALAREPPRPRRNEMQADKTAASQVAFWSEFLAKPAFQRSESDVDRAVTLLRCFALFRNASEELLEVLTKSLALVEMAQGQRLETVQVVDSRFLRPAIDTVVLLDGRVQWAFPAPLRHTRVVGHVFSGGDAISGSRLFRAVLPFGSSFVCEQRATTALVLSEDAAQHIVNDADARELQSRMAFLRTLTVPLVTSWTDAEVADLARALVPLRLPSHAVVVREHEATDALYFVRTGKLKVVREIDFSGASSSPAAAAAVASGGGGGAPSSPGGGGGGGTSSAAATTGRHDHKQHPPNAKLLELATLCPGEYFGELGLISRDVDTPRATTLNKDAIMALARESLLPDARRMAAAAAASASSPDLITGATSHEAAAAAMVGGASTTHVTAAGNVLPVDASVVRTTVVGEKGEVALVTLPRQATVYAHTAVDLLMLPLEAFDRLFVRASGGTRAHATVALLKLREYALGYPTQAAIVQAFARQRDWAALRGRLAATGGSS
jgi:CRP-like cAMP-binding protein